MEAIIAILLAAATLAAAVSTSVIGARTGQHRGGPTVADIHARLQAEHAHPYVTAGRW